MLFYVQVLAAASGCTSAVFWIMAAIVKTPTDFSVGFGGTGGSAQELTQALASQGRRNALAAIFAAISAVSQIVAMGLATGARV